MAYHLVNDALAATIVQQVRDSRVFICRQKTEARDIEKLIRKQFIGPQI